MIENNDFLTKQIITYLGNKRSLLDFIGSAIDLVCRETNKKKLILLMFFLDLELYQDF